MIDSAKIKSIGNWFTENRVLKLLLASIILYALLHNAFCSTPDRVPVKDTVIEATTQTTLKDGTKVTNSSLSKVDEKTLKELIERGKKSDALLYELFHKVDSYTKSNTVTKLDPVEVTYKDTVPCTFSKSGVFKDKLQSYDWQSTQKGFKVSNLKSYDSITRITGTERKWFLGKETYTVKETHSNPNVITTESKTWQLETKTPWYRSTVAKMVYGAILIKGAEKALE
jgi:hypothetical protein